MKSSKLINWVLGAALAISVTSGYGANHNSAEKLTALSSANASMQACIESMEQDANTLLIQENVPLREMPEEQSDVDETVEEAIRSLEDQVQSLEAQVVFLESEKANLVESNEELSSEALLLMEAVKEYSSEAQAYSDEAKEYSSVAEANVKAKKAEAETVKKKETTTAEPEEVTCTYILNKNTKKFHYPGCGSVKQMKEKNKKEVDATRDEVIHMGYSPCHNCNP